ncbi:hypothetical protein [Psychrobacter glacincola]|uniref:hypothetical protein n=1 Tax=Psychrobacter glacincola TaxID=56810 RepID=UPI0039AF81BD
MRHIDIAWLTQLRYDEVLLPQLRWQDIGSDNVVVTDKHLYQGIRSTLLNDKRELLDKQIQAIEYLSILMYTVVISLIGFL